MSTTVNALLAHAVNTALQSRYLSVPLQLQPTVEFSLLFV